MSSLRRLAAAGHRRLPPALLHLASRRAVHAYVPQPASTLSIDPITPRAKPPPFFYTGKPNLYALYHQLTSAQTATEHRLRAQGLWPPIEGMQAFARVGWKWKSQDEMLELANITVMTKTEYEKLLRILTRLTRMRHYANVVGDLRSVSSLTSLLAPFERIPAGATSRLLRSLEIGSDGTDGGSVRQARGTQTLDRHGRSYTSGTRKAAKAYAYLIPVETVARALNAVSEAREHRAFLAAEAAKDERHYAVRRLDQASGAQKMAAVWLQADLERGRELERENARLRKLGLEGEPVPQGMEVGPDGKLTKPIRDPAKRFALASASSPSGGQSSSSSSSSSPSPEETAAASADPKRVSDPTPLLLTGPSPPTTPPSSSTPLTPPPLGVLSFPTSPVPPPNPDPQLGQILINNTPLHRYFASPKDREAVLRPFVIARLTGAFNVFATVKAGGSTGQAEALALAIGRGLAVHQPMAKLALAKWGLSADTRQVERKKTGRPKARKANTWVKR